ncbi:hypothetical protein IPV27_19290 [Acidovorax sp. SD340]|uniref:Uncharacterized protein n=1 Tax=Acidovorax facilis TaxID=12917 RepID=A0ABV8DBP0_9BURK|nr:hypothetical protein [Acidovorax sp. SD340]MBO1009810.1 hypothetical protein [Acidovorax sp. SD340]
MPDKPARPSFDKRVGWRPGFGRLSPNEQEGKNYKNNSYQRLLNKR